MSKIIKIIDTEHIEIREYKSPNLVFNTNEYDINDKFCILREVINPFTMQQQIDQLTNNWNELEKFINDMLFTTEHENQILDFILDKMKEIKKKNNE